MPETQDLELASANPIQHSNSTSVRYFNNCSSGGQLIQGVLVPSGGAAVKQDELETLIEDAATIGFL